MFLRLALLPIYRKSQQYVPRHGISRITRGYKQHPAGHHRTHAVNRSPVRLYAIHRLEILHRVKVSDDLTETSFIGADMSVP